MAGGVHDSPYQGTLLTWSCSQLSCRVWETFHSMWRNMTNRGQGPPLSGRHVCCRVSTLGLFLMTLPAQFWPSATSSEIFLLPRRKFISLILHPRTSPYLLYGKPFSTRDMKLKTMSYDVCVRNKRCVLSLTGRKQGQVWRTQSSLSCRGHAMQGSVSTGVS